MAERQIVEQTGRGVVCFISNYSWLDGLSFTGMRERYLELFDHIWIDSLNGDKYRTGKLTPEGKSDPSVFSTEFNREGIQVGTAVALLARTGEHKATDHIRYRNLWGKGKLEHLANTNFDNLEEVYERVEPVLEIGLPFMPSEASENYFAWPLLTEVFPTYFPGVKTSRDDFVIDADKQTLVERMKKYFDPNVTHGEMRQIAPSGMENTGNFDAEATRDYLSKRGFLANNLVRYCYRPFDIRWLYWEPEKKLLDRSRSDYFSHVFEGNIWIEARQKQSKEVFSRGYVTSVLADNFGSGLSSFFPLYLASSKTQASLFEDASTSQSEPNLTEAAKAYISDVGTKPVELFYHSVAVIHSLTYRTENAGALRQDWPRIPLPRDKSLLESSAALGRGVAGLLETETPVTGVTSGAVRGELRVMGGGERGGGGEPEPGSGGFGASGGLGPPGAPGRDHAGAGPGGGARLHAGRTGGFRSGRGASGDDPERDARPPGHHHP